MPLDPNSLNTGLEQAYASIDRRAQRKRTENQRRMLQDQESSDPRMLHQALTQAYTKTGDLPNASTASVRQAELTPKMVDNTLEYDKLKNARDIAEINARGRERAAKVRADVDKAKAKPDKPPKQLDVRQIRGLAESTVDNYYKDKGLSLTARERMINNMSAALSRQQNSDPTIDMTTFAVDALEAENSKLKGGTKGALFWKSPTLDYSNPDLTTPALPPPGMPVPAQPPAGGPLPPPVVKKPVGGRQF